MYGTDDPMDLADTRRGLASGTYYGFEVKPLEATQLGNLDMTLEQFLDEVRDGPVTHVLVLERKNYLLRLVSLVAGQRKKRWHRRRHEERDKVTVEIPCGAVREGTEVRSLVQWFELQDEMYRRIRETLPESRTLWLTYEEDVQEDPVLAYRKVCDFLGVDPDPVEVRFGRTNPWSLDEMVENVAAVRECLEDTRWRWMLEEA